jgi:PAS domain S-box-containing protein
VTKYQRVQNELTVREREMRGLLSAIADIVLMVDRGGRLQAANPAFSQLLGWSVDEWLGADLSSIVNLKERLQEHPRAGRPNRFVAAVRRSDGKTVQCDVVMSKAEHGDGATRFVAVIRPLPARGQASEI